MSEKPLPAVEKIPITAETKEWIKNIDAVLPIDGADIPSFKSWVNCNGFLLNRETREGHNGFDFAAYLRDDGAIVLGLSPVTPVRAVADGTVKQVLVGGLAGGPYGCTVNIEHGANGSGMFSTYIHIDPTIKDGARVSKSDIIGKLYKAPGSDEGSLVHLHMGLTDGWGTHGTSIRGGDKHLRSQDIGLIDPSIYQNTVSVQGYAPFDPSEIPGANRIEIANFNTVRVGDYEWHS